MEKMNDTTIQKAVSIVRRMNADERMREVARSREEAIVAETLALNEARDKKAIEIALKMIRKGLPLNEISDYTSLPVSQISSLSSL
jgi:hypothetical protein